MCSWFTFIKNKPKEIIAIDIGTASVSAALARIGSSGLFEIISVLRYPTDLLNDYTRNDRQKRMLHVLNTALTKAFADMHQLSSSDSIIRISFADPFCEEQELETIINRSNPKKLITNEEVDIALKNTQDWKLVSTVNKKEHKSTLSNILCEVVKLKINGYVVEEVVGYCGNTLEIKARALFISQALKDVILENKEKFYPHNILEYYSDSDILKRAIVARKIVSMPILAIDIGGEVTSIFILQSSTIIQKCAPVFFGLRTLERRIATFLKIDNTHAVAILRQYVDGLLDGKALIEKIETIISGFLEDWYAGISLSIKGSNMSNKIAKTVVVGSGREIRSFIEYLGIHAKEFSKNESNMLTEAFLVETNLFLPEKSLFQGGDVTLASLILYAR